MKYAKTNAVGGIESGTFASLWPNTSASDKNGFARARGYSPVSSTLPFENETQALRPCPLYFSNGGFYDVEVVQRPLADVVRAITTLVQERLDAFAASRGYDGILSACTYATSTVPKFQSEGQVSVNARDATWGACYAVLAAIQAGERLMPTMAEFVAELPTLEWPT